MINPPVENKISIVLATDNAYIYRRLFSRKSADILFVFTLHQIDVDDKLNFIVFCLLWLLLSEARDVTAFDDLKNCGVTIFLIKMLADCMYQQLPRHILYKVKSPSHQNENWLNSLLT